MSDFDWGIFASKAAKKFIIGALIGGLGELYNFINTSQVPTEYIWIIAFSMQVIDLVLNAIKHKYLA